MSTDRAETLGDRIRFVRSSRGWSQAHLADLAGMKKAQLSRYEVGASMPRAEVLHRLAIALGVSQTWLRGGDVSINEHEDCGPDARVVPIPEETIEKLIAIATIKGLSITDTLASLLDDAFEQVRGDGQSSSPKAQHNTELSTSSSKNKKASE